jgi:POT family proton-dependent oligopeptide transporter
MEEKKNPLKEIVQPFIDLVRAPRALWGINIPYFVEGFVYFGILNYLAIFFNEYVGLSEGHASIMVGVQTWGITLAMFFLGGLSDRWGVRKALLVAFALMLVGRAIIAFGAVTLPGEGLWSSLHLVAMLGILFVVIGYGLYQPASYSAIRQFMTPETAGMGYAMLYALMNLGGFLPTFLGPLRRAIDIPGLFLMFACATCLSLLATYFILSPKVVREAIEKAKASREDESVRGKEDDTEDAPKKSGSNKPKNILEWLKNHPLADAKFSFFIFSLIPVQTLFAHNWLTLPMYVERAYKGTFIGDNFEIAVNLNPILIFILVPIIAALTQKLKVYNLMVVGTFVMASSTFFVALKAHPITLFLYLVCMTVGEAIWQPRFLQYAAEIAPKGKTGAYMGVAQFPWFLTKVITSLYAGFFLEHYCPREGRLDTETMWLIYFFIAISSPVMLLLARRWLQSAIKGRTET